MAEREANVVLLQIVVGVQPDETEDAAKSRAVALWDAEVDLNDDVVRIADPLIVVEDIDPEVNEGFSRAVNVCGNVIKR